MTPFRRMGIVGVGLIGGSIGLVARRGGLAGEIVGVGRTRANLDVALERGIIDRAGSDPAILAGADLVVLATPVGALAGVAAAIAPYIAEDAIVTDVGSVKSAVVRDCTAALSSRHRFVGSHPIAGTEDSGAAAADVDLFRGARCIVTPVAETDLVALSRVRHLWEAAGMTVSEMPPEEHDAILALSSHVPHLLAFALALAAGEPAGTAQDVLGFAGPSFRDATRVAASSPEMWRDILLANSPAVSRALERVSASLGSLADAMRSRDAATLTQLIEEARRVRMRLAHCGPDVPAERSAVSIAPAVGPLRGTIVPPGDKSIAHRALIFGAVARGTTMVHGVAGGQDNASTIHVLANLGVTIERDGDTVRIAGRDFAGLRPFAEPLDCGNSGTTMRLMAGLLAARPFVSRLTGDASLCRRPMQRVIVPLEAMGACISSTGGHAPLTVDGRELRAADVQLPIASAQVKTALLMAALQTNGTTVISEPGPSRDHSERLLPAFGARVEHPRPLVVSVRGPQELHACEVHVPADPSAAAFWLVAGSIVPGSRILLRDVSVNPTRTGALDVLRAMGAQITVVPRAAIGEEPVADLEVSAAPLHGTIVQGEMMLRAIDEFPVLAIAAAVATGETRFADAAELRVKESDRLATMAKGLARLAVRVEEHADGLTVQGGSVLHGGEVESHGDHRVAMAFAVAALVARAPITIDDAASIAVSDPSFLETLARLRAGA